MEGQIADNKGKVINKQESVFGSIYLRNAHKSDRFKTDITVLDQGMFGEIAFSKLS